jgi:hypothetical protein
MPHDASDISQHIKSVAADHGLNGGGDAIVMGLQTLGGSEVDTGVRAGPDKMSSCIAGNPTGSIGEQP